MALILESDRKTIVPSSTPVDAELEHPAPRSPSRGAAAITCPWASWVRTSSGCGSTWMRWRLSASGSSTIRIGGRPTWAGPTALSRPDRARAGDATGSGGGSRSGAGSPAPTIWRRGRGRSSSNDGLVVLAEEQTAGRGRRGRSWTAPPCSSILMSVVLFPPPHLAPGPPRGGLRLRLADRAGRGCDRRGGHRLDRPRCHDQVAQRRPHRRAQDRRHPGRTRAGPGGRPDRRARRRDGRGWGAVIGIGLNVNLDRDGVSSRAGRRRDVAADRRRRRAVRPIGGRSRLDPAAGSLVRRELLAGLSRS